MVAELEEAGFVIANLGALEVCGVDAFFSESESESSSQETCSVSFPVAIGRC
jgi:hypothetical protein